MCPPSSTRIEWSTRHGISRTCSCILATSSFVISSVAASPMIIRAMFIRVLLKLLLLMAEENHTDTKEAGSRQWRARIRYNLSVGRMLLKLRPMRLAQRPQPFDHPDWILRALAYIEDGESDLISRKSHTYKSFRELRVKLATCIKVENAIIDSEIVCLGDDGRPQFYELLYRRREPFFLHSICCGWMVRTCERYPSIKERSACENWFPVQRDRACFSAITSSERAARWWSVPLPIKWQWAEA